MGELSEKACIPCRDGAEPLSPVESQKMVSLLNDHWALVENHHLEREWSFPNFAEALAYVVILGGICEEEGHHADFELSWGRVSAVIYTHKIDGLTESDFILAAKFDNV